MKLNFSLSAIVIALITALLASTVSATTLSEDAMYLMCKTTAQNAEIAMHNRQVGVSYAEALRDVKASAKFESQGNKQKEKFLVDSMKSLYDEAYVVPILESHNDKMRVIKVFSKNAESLCINYYGKYVTK